MKVLTFGKDQLILMCKMWGYAERGSRMVLRIFVCNWITTLSAGAYVPCNVGRRDKPPIKGSLTGMATQDWFEISIWRTALS